jgi:hypothetical protein
MRWLALLLLCGCIVQPIKPIPDDNVPTPIPAKAVDAAAHKAMKDYAAGMSKAFAEAAAAKHEKASDANGELAKSNRLARQQAFSPVDAILDERIGGEKWDADEAVKLFGELSTAFGKAVK